MSKQFLNLEAIIPRSACKYTASEAIYIYFIKTEATGPRDQNPLLRTESRYFQ